MLSGTGVDETAMSVVSNGGIEREARDKFLGWEIYFRWNRE